VLAQALNVKVYGVPDQAQYFVPGRSDSNTAGQIGNMGAERTVALFDNNGVLHVINITSIPPALGWY
jgi:hypothetical protein